MQEESKEIFEKTEKSIEIQPKTKYLSAQELISLRNVEIPNVSAGLKRTKVENSLDEQNELESLYDNLQKQLSRPRIERLAGRAVGVWDAEKHLVRVERKDGKFGNFGFNIEGQLYLEYYEALFLMEVNRLQLEYNSIIMSIEQAYLLLMGEDHSLKYQEYLVYSNLTRIGFIVVKHQNKNFPKHQINSEIDCVWAILEAELQNDTVADYIKKTPFYGKVKQKFDLIKNIIKNQTESENVIKPDEEKETLSQELNFQEKIKPNLKRKASGETQNEWLRAKRHCNYNLNITNRSFVDFLKEEDEYKQFKETFEKFDIVPLKRNEKKRNKESKKEDEEDSSESESDSEMNNLNINYRINFDVYLHNDGFRKSSPHLPNFRVIVLDTEQRFPTHDEIYHTHRQQLNPVPLLIVSINDSKQMQAFLYYFS
ncbi:tRNA splicing endonuclease subunit 54 [Cochliomyia hominivorax]